MRTLADERALSGLIDTLAASIGGQISRSEKPGGWGLVGIRSRGDVIAARLAARLDPAALQGRVGMLDITLYRDDLSEVGAQPVVQTTEIPFGIDGLDIVLVDDVLMTGRSVRAALQSLMDLGRPRRVWLAVLVDRGGRELPVAPDYVALDLTRGEAGLKAGERVEVRIKPKDAEDAIVVRAARDRARKERA